MPGRAAVEAALSVRYRHRAFRWWRVGSLGRRVIRELGRAVRAPTRAAALFLTIAGVLLSAVGLGLTFDGDLLGAVGATSTRVLAILVVLVVFLISGMAVWRLLPADELASFLVQGRATSEILETIALRIHRLANRFVRETARVSDLPRRLLEARNGPKAQRAGLVREVERAIRAIHALHQGQDHNIRRIEALKWEAARELQVSTRSLCDHVLQFSPVMFRIGVGKYIRNLREMVELIQAKGFDRADEERFRGLLEQNLRLEEDCGRRVWIQERLLRFRDLHSDICALSSTRSTSSSLQAYCRALSGLARRQRRRLTTRTWRRWRRWNGSIEDPVYVETYERFLFLYRRQQAHPGFDLHALLVKAVASPLLASRFPSQVVHRLGATLRAMGWTARPAAELPPAGTDEDDPRERLEGHLQRYLERLDALQEVYRYFNSLATLSREAMRGTFTAVLEEWSAGLARDSVVYLVTLGYSKTVRELIRYGLTLSGEVAERAEPEIQLYQLLAGDRDELDTRLMAWELGDLRLGRSVRAAAGSGEMLASLSRPGDRVLVLLGAEAIDSERRVVHPRAVLDRLLPMVDALNGARVPVLVVVAAESYKRHDRAFTIGPLYHGHFERVGIYDAARVDLVISDQDPDPADWRRVVSHRLRLWSW